VSVRTETKCWLLKLGREAFREVIMTHPHVLAVVGEISARQREQALAVEEKLPLL
jgi:CRP-like cAMP-binding protein